MQGGWTKQTMGESELANARLRVWGTTNPDTSPSFPPLSSAPLFLTSLLSSFERNGVSPLDQGYLVSELISVGPPLSANSRLFIILAACPPGRVHILCSIKQDSIASPACPGAVPLPSRHRNHHNCSANHVPVPTWTSPSIWQGPGSDSRIISARLPHTRHHNGQAKRWPPTV